VVHGRECRKGSLYDDSISMSCRDDCSSESASCTCRAVDHDLVVGGDDVDDGIRGDGDGGGHGKVRVGERVVSVGSVQITSKPMMGARGGMDGEVPNLRLPPPAAQKSSWGSSHSLM